MLKYWYDNRGWNNDQNGEVKSTVATSPLSTPTTEGGQTEQESTINSGQEENNEEADMQPPPLVVMIKDFESFDAPVLQDFISILR